ncbi:outer membrane lipoprotein carrier protein LolA [Streptomyces sp. NPDC050161]|uniref:outer membrane lipoprotein carrier protein LolA n=1 Tax=Streptomyces sp. NPDC050161 TaxID=3365604 RepID=UPI0037A6566A
MPRNEPTEVADDRYADGERSTKRRKAVRYGVPVAVAGVAAATIGLVPAFAGSGAPDLPEISAQQLIAKVAASDTQQLSGTFRVSTDLGLPSLPGGLGGAGGEGGAKGDGASASPQSKLMELASGVHTLKVAADGPERQRVSIVDRSAEYSFVHNGQEVWAYDGGSNTAVHSRSAGSGKHAGQRGGPEDLPKGLENATPKELAKEALKAAGDTTSVTVDGTAKVAGRDAYQLVIKPKQSASTVGAIRIAVDAGNGVPLKFTLTPKSGGAAAVEAGFTEVDFGKPAAATFAFTPPKGAKVVDGDKQHADGLPEGFKGSRGAKGPQGLGGFDVVGKGWTSIATIKGSGSGLPSGKEGGAASFLDSIGDKVTGDFGSGRVFSTRLVNALMTDDGSVYVGAVDKQALVNAANAAGSAK